MTRDTKGRTCQSRGWGYISVWETICLACTNPELDLLHQNKNNQNIHFRISLSQNKGEKNPFRKIVEISYKTKTFLIWK